MRRKGDGSREGGIREKEEKHEEGRKDGEIEERRENFQKL